MENLKSCFILSPIGEEGSSTREYFDKVRRHIIEPVTSELGYNTIRSDDIPRPGTITRQIIEHICNDDLVIADLTDKNPNVFYELAGRHAVGKPVILMGALGDKIPFDLAAQRVIFYDLDPDHIEKAKTDLKNQIEEVNAETFIVDSPFEDVFRLDRSTRPFVARTEENEVIALLRAQSERLSRVEDQLRPSPIPRLSTSTSTSSHTSSISSITISPRTAKPGRNITMLTTNHTSGGTISVFFDFIDDDFLIKSAMVQPDGSCALSLQIPKSAEPGEHQLLIRDGTTGNVKIVPFEVSN